MSWLQESALLLNNTFPDKSEQYKDYIKSNKLEVKSIYHLQSIDFRAKNDENFQENWAIFVELRFRGWKLSKFWE